MTKDIVILTKSAKHGKFCVAGIELKTGKWIRLVSSDDDTDGALSNNDMRLLNGGFCEPLDLVRVEIEKAVPEKCQTENHLVVYGKRWVKLDELTIEEIMKVHAPTNRPYIFGNNLPYINGIDYMTYSLVLAEVSKLKMYYNELGSRKVNFEYNSKKYSGISMTDPDYYDLQEHEFEKAYIVVSIPNNDYNGKYYKFVAKVFPVNGFVIKNNHEDDDLPF